jgi:hypothetical protein
MVAFARRDLKGTDMTELANRGKKPLGVVLALALAGAGLTGCVVYPDNGYQGGYYAGAPVVVAPAPVIVGGWGGCWGCGRGWGGGGRHWR